MEDEDSFGRQDDEMNFRDKARKALAARCPQKTLTFDDPRWKVFYDRHGGDVLLSAFQRWLDENNIERVRSISKVFLRTVEDYIAALQVEPEPVQDISPDVIERTLERERSEAFEEDARIAAEKAYAHAHRDEI